MNLGRLARTVSKLHRLQVFARAPNALLARVVRSVPRGMAPSVIETWPEAPVALRKLANAERARGVTRLARLPAGRLRDYESTYGLELGADDHTPPADWRAAVALEPYPASVRARRIAVAIRCGRQDLGGELARAARAVLIRPELHLLGNHLLENGIGLACAGAVAQGAEANVWWCTGARLLAWQLPEQFLADGGHVERSASYHMALTAALLELLELAEASGRGAPPLWRDVASRALGWATVVRTPDAGYPLFNDASLDAAPDVEAVLTLGAALGIAAGSVGEVKLSGGARAIILPATGWVRLDLDRACVFVDAGPDADGWQPGHAHADGLTFELWVDGARCIVDFGVASYEAGAARSETRSTRSHNTVELGAENSCEVWGAFRVGRRGRGYVRACEVSDATIRVRLEHDGYAWRTGAPCHERAIELQSGCLRVSDGVSGGVEPWVSRLRVDPHGCARLRIGGHGAVQRRDDRWYPRHAEAHPAVVFEQLAPGGRMQKIMWLANW